MGNEIASVTADATASGILELFSHNFRGIVDSVNFSPDGKQMVVGHQVGEGGIIISVWRLKKDAPLSARIQFSPRRAGWTWVVAHPGLPQIRTCTH